MLTLVFATMSAIAEIKISGRVVDSKDRPVKGANVYLNNTIDGATTDSVGAFSFSTTEVGNQTLVATDLGHENMGIPIFLAHDTAGIVLRMLGNVVHDLESVTITAGSFEASNDKTKTVLKPLDIVTTAGANADVVKAIQMLPGTQQTGTENGLFVRGGDASEAAIIVDEMVVQNAFFSGGPGVATRSRFGAFSYQGVSFSSGGYGPRYGQALSGVLELNTTDMPDKSNVNLGISMAGLYGSATKKWKNSSLDFGGNYTNLAPFYKLATTNFNFYDVPVGGGGNARFVWKPNKDGIFKASFNGTYNHSGIGIPNPYAGDSTNYLSQEGNPIKFVTKDAYYYANASYKQMFKSKYSLYTTASYSLDNTDNSFGTNPLKETDYRSQFRIEGKDFLTSRMNLLVGTEIQNFGIEKKNTFGTYTTNPKFDETQLAGYTELEYTPVYWLAVKPGLRYEHSQLISSDNIAPRLSMAIKTSRHSQASVATGVFYQNPGNQYLLANLRPKMQQAIHYIVNWQYNRNERTLRLEGYYKNYQDLVREPRNVYIANRYRVVADTTYVDNSGYGYAQGFELFYRDKKSIKNADFWVSYSFIDTRRLYENYKFEATPTFIANHNLNLVGKYFVTKWNTNFSATYSFAAGYPYFNPEHSEVTADNFLKDKTPAFNNVALSVAYLHSFGRWFTVFYVSIDNLLDTHNIYGYRYSYDSKNKLIPGSRSDIVPALYRTVFFGVNCSLTQFSKDEL